MTGQTRAKRRKSLLVTFFQKSNFLLLLCFLAGLASIAAGQDGSWDLQNYHIYNGYALLHPARWHDFVFAQSQSFLNPILDVPLSWLDAAFPDSPRAVAFCMGLPFGVLAFCTIRLAVRLFAGRPYGVWAAAAAVIFGLSGSATVSQIGLSSNEVLVAACIIAALDILLAAPEKLSAIAWSGLFAGLATGGKLTAAPYAVGLAAALLAASPPRRWPAALGVLAATGLAGTMLTGGFWMVHLQKLYGSPIFPYANQFFNSPWAGAYGYNDTRFFPRSHRQALFYPFWWARWNLGVVSEQPFADPRFAVLFCIAGLAALTALARRRAVLPAAPWRALTAFWLVSYVLWEKEFSIFRYVIPLEATGGMLLVACLRGVAPARPAPATAAAVLLTAAICRETIFPQWGHIPFQHRAIPAALPNLTAGSLVISSGPMADSFVAALAPPGVTFVGGNSNFYVPDNTLTATRIAGTIAGWRGKLEILEPAGAGAGAGDVLSAKYGIITQGNCQPVLSAYQGNPLQLCPAGRENFGPDSQKPENFSFAAGDNGVAYAVSGWAPAEFWGMWSAAPDAILRVPVNPRNKHKLLITILCFSIPDAKSPGRQVDFYANGSLLAHWSLNRFPETFSATVPSVGGQAFLTLRFHTLDPISVAGDTRQLGIALQHLTLQESIENQVSK